MRPAAPVATLRPSSRAPLPASVDLVVVGAGIVGLAHAVEAHTRGHSVLVVDRDPRAGGASARRSGHVAVTTQDAATLSCALTSRERWLKLGREAGFWVKDSGAVVVARAADELAVLDDLVAARDGDAHLLDAAETASRARVAADGVVGGAFLPLDLRIDPQDALGALAAWLDDRPRADVAWSTTALTFEAGSGRTLVRTSRGEVVARRVVIAVGPDVERWYPDTAAGVGLRHEARQMLRVAPLARPADVDPGGPAVVGGTALLRDGALVHSPARTDVRERLRNTAPGLLDAGVHLAFTRHDGPAGASVVVGDAHRPAAEPLDGSGLDRDPARSDVADELLLAELTTLLGEPVQVLRRWTVPELVLPRQQRGQFAGTTFLVTSPVPGVTAVTVTGGLGTTTALGLATKVVDSLF